MCVWSKYFLRCGDEMPPQGYSNLNNLCCGDCSNNLFILSIPTLKISIL